MKKLKLLAIAIIVFVLGMFANAVYADMADDICDDLGYYSRWTVKAKLDDTYEGTWLYNISNQNYIEMDIISVGRPFVLDEAIDEEARYVWDIMVVKGNEEVAVAMAPASNRFDEFAVVKDGDDYKIVDAFDDASPLAKFGGPIENNMLLFKMKESREVGYSLLLADNIGLTPLERYPDNSFHTPIMVDENVLQQAHDSVETISKYSPGRQFDNLENYNGFSETIKAEYVYRPYMKKVYNDFGNYYTEFFAMFSNLEELIGAWDELGMTEDDFDPKEPTWSDELIEIRAKVNSKAIHAMLLLLNGMFEGTDYYMTEPTGIIEFDVDVPPEKLTDELRGIAPDGELNIKIELFDWGEFCIYQSEPIDTLDKMMIITYSGIEGSLQGIDTSEGAVINPLTGGYSVQPLQLLAYDEYRAYHAGSDALRYPRIFPRLYFGMDLKTNKINSVGLELYEKFPVEIYQQVQYTSEVIKHTRAVYDIYDVPLEEAKITIFKNGETYEPKEDESEIIPETEGNSKNENETDNIIIKVNGEELESDVAPEIDNDRVLVPLRVIFEVLDADVYWNGETGAITVAKGDNEIVFEVNSTDVIVNGEVKTMDTAAKTTNNRTLIPLRFLAEELGYTVNWDGETREVTVDTIEETQTETTVDELEVTA